MKSLDCTAYPMSSLVTGILASRFTSHIMTEVCRLLNIKQGMSTAYWPQTDGQTERTNRTLEEMLCHFVNPVHDDWDEHLPVVDESELASSQGIRGC